ncbi:hypothetical protein PVAP13_4KG175403 [Panicum virgatum]|uniref:Uncharacterized protein n=1 Tax=Panicum virgatum TaxID=38727 RepID=A0A8T0TNP8_PANVG|nr:hypothetical protein PVAP13_4KG175403 [Panicum virgatum]
MKAAGRTRSRAAPPLPPSAASLAPSAGKPRRPSPASILSFPAVATSSTSSPTRPPPRLLHFLTAANSSSSWPANLLLFLAAGGPPFLTVGVPSFSFSRPAALPFLAAGGPPRLPPPLRLSVRHYAPALLRRELRRPCAPSLSRALPPRGPSACGLDLRVRREWHGLARRWRQPGGPDQRGLLRRGEGSGVSSSQFLDMLIQT